MDDRYKFRFWNKRQMIYDDIPHLELYNSDDYEIMQCTGLKDKNGTLIYEGDIVKSYNDEICVIDYCVDEGGFYIKSFEHINHSFDTLTFKFEVIGNIYENPELNNIKE